MINPVRGKGADIGVESRAGVQELVAGNPRVEGAFVLRDQRQQGGIGVVIVGGQRPRPGQAGVAALAGAKGGWLVIAISFRQQPVLDRVGVVEVLRADHTHLAVAQVGDGGAVEIGIESEGRCLLHGAGFLVRAHAVHQRLIVHRVGAARQFGAVRESVAIAVRHGGIGPKQQFVRIPHAVVVRVVGEGIGDRGGGGFDAVIAAVAIGVGVARIGSQRDFLEVIQSIAVHVPYRLADHPHMFVLLIHEPQGVVMEDHGARFAHLRRRGGAAVSGFARGPGSRHPGEAVQRCIQYADFGARDELIRDREENIARAVRGHAGDFPQIKLGCARSAGAGRTGGSFVCGFAARQLVDGVVLQVDAENIAGGAFANGFSDEIQVIPRDAHAIWLPDGRVHGGSAIAAQAVVANAGKGGDVAGGQVNFADEEEIRVGEVDRVPRRIHGDARGHANLNAVDPGGTSSSIA
ncbi:MAG: hypothetical protein GMKNLPBB_03196 [Myxococcota bacterium]|nr:hypothetical protein [Myxococcota bacterium]